MMESFCIVVDSRFGKVDDDCGVGEKPDRSMISGGGGKNKAALKLG